MPGQHEPMLIGCQLDHYRETSLTLDWSTIFFKKMKLENVVWVVTAIVYWPQDVKTGVAFSDHKVVVTPSRISIHGYKHYIQSCGGGVCLQTVFDSRSSLSCDWNLTSHVRSGMGWYLGSWWQAFLVDHPINSLVPRRSVGKWFQKWNFQTHV